MSRSFWLRAGLLVSLQLSSLCALSDQPLFHIRDLGPGVARGLNDFGQVVGIFQGDGAVWSETTGFTSLLPYQPSPSTSAPVAINNAGQVTGATVSSGPPPPGFLLGAYVFWDSPQAAPIVIISQPGLGPQAINSRGSVVGTTGGPSGQFPWIWRNGTLEVLPRLGSPFTGAALDINDAGVVVGCSLGRAVLWRDGVIQELGALPGQQPSEAFGINNAGAIVGRSGQDAFLWTAESGMISLGSLAGAQTFALDINDHGWVIGSAGSRGFLEGTPFLWRPGIGMTSLASLVDLTETGFADLADVSDINALGQIVGSALHSDGQTHGYLLTPVPEPTTWLVIAVGLLCVAFRLSGRRELRAPVGA